MCQVPKRARSDALHLSSTTDTGPNGIPTLRDSESGGSEEQLFHFGGIPNFNFKNVFAQNMCPRCKHLLGWGPIFQWLGGWAPGPSDSMAPGFAGVMYRALIGPQPLGSGHVGSSHDDGEK